MLLRLVEYERRKAEQDPPENRVPPNYQPVNLRWYIDLDSSGGRPPYFVSAGDSKRGQRISAPYRQPTSNILPSLLIGSGEYVLGLPREPRRQARANEAHRQFLDLVRQCAQATGEKKVDAVLKFLQQLDVSNLQLPQDFDTGTLITFRVDGVRVIDLPSVQGFWARWLADEEKAVVKGQCLSCGRQNAPIARLHDIKIKGIPGGQVAGTALVSFNADAFESYGLSQSFNAPVCQECAELYAKGLNRLISGEDTSLKLEKMVYVFWTRGPERFSETRLLSDPEPQDIQALLESPWKAQPAAPVEANAFYAAALSASGGRAVVRDWIESTIPKVQENLRRYFLRQRLPHLFGKEPRFFSIEELVRSLAPQQTQRRPGESNEPPDVATTTLVHSALTGAPLPDWMLFLAVRRNRAEQGPLTRNRKGQVISWARVALIKLALQSQDLNVEQNEEGTRDAATQQSPAYLCGRLLALLEQAQSEAIPNAKATLIDRFYGSASSACF